MSTIQTSTSPALRSKAPTPPPVSKRTIDLQGTWNTRQLGGLPTRGGTIPENMIIRSDALSGLTPADVARLKAIPVRTVVDFRVPIELHHQPADKYQAQNHVSLPMYADGEASPSTYRELMNHNKHSIGGFFATLAEPRNYPLLYHCQSGKDRTGINTALLLMVLGTPRDRIQHDYMESQHDKPTKQVDPSWIQAVFKEVDDAGGVEKFLATCGVTQQQLYSIRRILSK